MEVIDILEEGLNERIDECLKADPDDEFVLESFCHRYNYDMAYRQNPVFPIKEDFVIEEAVVELEQSLLSWLYVAVPINKVTNDDSVELEFNNGITIYVRNGIYYFQMYQDNEIVNQIAIIYPEHPKYLSFSECIKFSLENSDYSKLERTNSLKKIKQFTLAK